MRASKLPMPGVRRPFHYGLIILLCLVFDGFFGLQAKDYGGLEQQRVEAIFPGSDGLSEPDGEFKVRTIRTGKEVLGYVFQSQDVVDIPAYSGKPINMQVILDTHGVIQDAYVLEHHEPILLIGIPVEKLHAFDAKYKGVKADRRGGRWPVQ